MISPLKLLSGNWFSIFSSSDLTDWPQTQPQDLGTSQKAIYQVSIRLVYLDYSYWLETDFVKGQDILHVYHMARTLFCEAEV